MESVQKPRRPEELDEPVTPFTYKKRFEEDKQSPGEEEREMHTIFQEDSRK